MTEEFELGSAAPSPADLTSSLRIAYFITSYGPGPQLLRLVTTLRTAEPRSPIVIHHDTFASTLDKSVLESIPDVHILTSDHPIVWGDLTLESARWRVFRWILDNLDVDWLMLLSEQDYPIAPLADLRSRLGTDGVDAFIDARRIDEVTDPGTIYECEKRYLYHYVSLPSLGLGRWIRRRRRTPTKSVVSPQATVPPTGRMRPAAVAKAGLVRAIRSQRLLRYYRPPDVLNLPSKIGLRARQIPFSAEFPCWFNDCWFALSRKALEHVTSFLDDHPQFISYYNRTVIPLESATATILFNDPELNVANKSLHAIRWSDLKSGRPDVFHAADFDFLCSSGAPFARKFDISDPEILDELDKVVIGDAERP